MAIDADADRNADGIMPLARVDLFAPRPLLLASFREVRQGLCGSIISVCVCRRLPLRYVRLRLVPRPTFAYTVLLVFCEKKGTFLARLQ